MNLNFASLQVEHNVVVARSMEPCSNVIKCRTHGSKHCVHRTTTAATIRITAISTCDMTW